MRSCHLPRNRLAGFRGRGRGVAIRLRGLVTWLILRTQCVNEAGILRAGFLGDTTFHDSAPMIVFRLDLQKFMQAFQPIVRDVGVKVMGKVVVHSKRENSISEQRVNEKDSRIAEPALITIGVLNCLTHHHEEAERRDERNEPENGEVDEGLQSRGEMDQGDGE